MPPTPFEVRVLSRPDAVRAEFYRKPAICPITGVPYALVEEGRQVDAHAVNAGPFASGRPATDAPLTAYQASQPPIRYDKSPAERFQAIIQPITRTSPLPGPPEPPAETEIRKLREAGFDLAADLLRERNPEPPAPPRDPKALFDLGVVRIDMAINDVPTARQRLSELLTRHSRGDHGELGKNVYARLTADERWCPEHFGPAIESAAAIESGLGLVRSRFNLFTPEQAAKKPPNGRGWSREDPDRPPQPQDAIDVVTLLAPGQPAKTIVYHSR